MLKIKGKNHFKKWR